MKNKQQIEGLLKRFAAGNLSEAEEQELLGMLNNADLSQPMEEVLVELIKAKAIPEETTLADVESRASAILSMDKNLDESPGTGALIVRKSAYRLWWAAAAAAVLLIAGYWASTNEEEPAVSAPVNLLSQQIIAPGGEGAILTLADGSQLIIDSLGNGVVTTEDGTQVILADGQLSYGNDKGSAEEIGYHTMTTPKGRQFKLMLPDGTAIWLNASSSIRYPTVFTGTERNVEVTGEVYFEVVKNASMPFVVEVKNKVRVEVIGTSFNLNAYEEEPTIKTTLLTGSVKMRSSANDRFLMLKPGQQARYGQDKGELYLSETPDLEKVMAWKNGQFNFEDASLEEVMRELERWYNIKVVYEKKIPDMQFGGGMSRNLSLNSVLKALEYTRVKFRLEEGRQLVVYQ